MKERLICQEDLQSQRGIRFAFLPQHCYVFVFLCSLEYFVLLSKVLAVIRGKQIPLILHKLLLVPKPATNQTGTGPSWYL